MKKKEPVNMTTKTKTGINDGNGRNEAKVFLDGIPSIYEEDKMTNDEIFGDTTTYEKMNQRDIVTGANLDVPGAMLNDSMEDIGSADEENNYYSLGGDNHENLDESK